MVHFISTCIVGPVFGDHIRHNISLAFLMGVPFAAREWCRGLMYELAALLWFGGGGHSCVAISISPE